MKSDTLLLEASWEVCNKVGGIYTVITSKLAQVIEEFGQNYMAIGPYFPGAESPYFQETELPEKLKLVATTLRGKGVGIHYGHWLVEGKPVTILLDYSGLISASNQIKTGYWENYQLDSLGSDFNDLDQPLLWGTAVGMFVESYAQQNPKQPIIVQGHEWLAAALFLHLHPLNNALVKTVFTTHATVLGRALSSHNVFIYDKLTTLKPEEEARKYGVITKHQLESLGARLATVFTTVSKITAEEAQAFLGRAVDVVVENGLDSQQFPPFDQLCLMRSNMRERVDNFIAAYFFPSYRFDLSQTQYQFTMGRYEIHNKGYDLYLESLGQLNQKLKKQKSNKTVVSFLLVPAQNYGIRPEVVAQLTAYSRLSQLVSQSVTASRAWYHYIWNEGPLSSTLSSSLTDQITSLRNRLPQKEQVPISPYQLGNEALITISSEQGLLNRAEDRVKIIFLPVYLDGLDGIFNISIYELISAFDLGVFPSLYEPWGYTPLEALMMGIPSVTSNLAGFGRAVAEHTDVYSEGVFLLNRSSDAPEDPRQKLVSYFMTSLQESPRHRLTRRMAAYTKAQSFNWKHLYRNYRRAYLLAQS